MKPRLADDPTSLREQWRVSWTLKQNGPDLTSSTVVVSVSVSGDIDASNASDLAVLTWLRLDRGLSLILDLSGTDFFAVAGFWVLCAINEHCIAAGSHLVVIASAPVARLLDVCHP